MNKFCVEQKHIERLCIPLRIVTFCLAASNETLPTCDTSKELHRLKKNCGSWARQSFNTFTLSAVNSI
jgi:hypothetical protein